jgi:hypothetical protein
MIVDQKGCMAPDFVVWRSCTSSANGYKNPASSNSYEFTHGPKLPKNHFQKVQKYTTSYKIKV